MDSLSQINKQADFYEQVNPLREPLELKTTHFTPFELSLLEIAVPVNRLSNREHSPTSSFNIKQDYPDTEFAETATSLELYLHSQSYTPPLPTVSLSTLQAYPEAKKEESLEPSELYLEKRFRSYSPTHSGGGTNGRNNTLEEEHHNTQRVIKNFACDGCDRRFGSKKNLARHLKLHMNERKYVCTVCNRGFNRGDYLKKHDASMHQGVNGVGFY
jgi:uncharacterized Zn-finger protein